MWFWSTKQCVRNSQSSYATFVQAVNWLPAEKLQSQYSSYSSTKPENTNCSSESWLHHNTSSSIIPALSKDFWLQFSLIKMHIYQKIDSSSDYVQLQTGTGVSSFQIWIYNGPEVFEIWNHWCTTVLACYFSNSSWVPILQPLHLFSTDRVCTVLLPRAPLAKCSLTAWSEIAAPIHPPYPTDRILANSLLLWLSSSLFHLALSNTIPLVMLL